MSRPPPAAGSRLRVARCSDRVELQVGGIAFSSFHPERPWTGYVWDALAASACLAAAAHPSVLLLGGGAGTALALIRRLRPAAGLVAVESDPGVLEVARRRLGLDAVGAEVVAADGVEYLSRTRRRFDVILDDMYVATPGGLGRPVADETAWLGLVARRLAARGVAATNATTDGDPPGLERAVRRAYRATFPHRLAVSPRRGHNLVLAGSSRRLGGDVLAAAGEGLADEDARELRRLRVRDA